MTSAPAPQLRHWIGVVSRAHVLIGVAGGFAMLNHGKLAPLKRLQPGDWLIYYSPKTAIDGEPLRAFTAIGKVVDHAPYQIEMRPGFTPFRRDMRWSKATETPLASLTERLEFTKGNWGMLARRGLFGISENDFQTIRTVMERE